MCGEMAMNDDNGAEIGWRALFALISRHQRFATGSLRGNGVTINAIMLGRFSMLTAVKNRLRPVVLILLMAQMTGLFSTALSAQPPSPVDRLAALAGLLSVEDEVVQWDFVAIVLDSLLASYELKLESSYRVRPGGSMQRQRLRRWQRATEAYVTMIYAMRVALDDGAAFALFVDGQAQIVIDVDDRVIMLTGRGEPDADLVAGNVERRFCAANDCRWLGMRTPQPVTSRSRPNVGRGDWSNPGDAGIRYTIGQRFAFEFTGQGNRDGRAMLGDAMADELDYLNEELLSVVGQGYLVDWEFMAGAQPAIREQGTLQINADGEYLEVALLLLAGLQPEDWRQVVFWLAGGGREMLLIRRADALDRE